MNHYWNRVDVNQLPGIVPELVDVIGYEKAIALIEQLGGVDLYVPLTVEPDHLIAKVVGHAAACKIAAAFGGDEFAVPKCERALKRARNIEIVKAMREGTKAKDLALEHNLTERRIFEIKAELLSEENSNQQSLF